MNSIIAGWLLTYALHSCVAFLITLLIADRVASHAWRARVWRAAILAPIVTSLLVFAWGPNVSFERSAAPAVAAPTRVGVLPAELDGATDVGSDGAFASARRIQMSWPQAIVAAWLVMAVVLLVRLAVQAIAFRREVGNDRADALAPLLVEVARRAGIDREVTLLWSDRVGIPVAIGRATIVVPRRTADLPPAEQRVLLGHEVAHLIRRDPQWLLLLAAAEAVLFFQPLNRIARRRLVEASELAADELAVELTRDGMSLAKCLVKVAEWSGGPLTGHGAAMATPPSQLAKRVEHILQPRTNSRSRLAFACVPLLVIATAATPGVRFTSTPPTPMPRIEVPSTVAAEHPALALFREAATRPYEHPDPIFNPPARAQWVLKIAAGRELVPALLEKLRDDDWIAREHATWALAVAPDPRAVDPLLAALRDDAWRVRGGAASTLGAIGDPRATPSLLPLLGDEHWQVRTGAVQSIGELSSDRDMIPRLRPLLDDPHIAVRHSAEEAIAAIERRTRANP